jgi:ribosomal protein S18 acetylase RimI-like enzyme
MTFNATIQKATPTDLPKIQTIINTSFPRFYRHFAYRSVSNFKTPTLTATTPEGIAGFAKLIEFNVGDKRCGCILWIAVAPEFRRQGIGVLLARAAIEEFRARGAGLVFASTQHDNLGALGSLGKAGFVRVGFGAMRRLFGWRVFGFYKSIWFVPTEIVLMHGNNIVV